MSELRHRRLAAIMFTDMVGYTQLMELDEEAARAARLRHRAALEAALSTHDGQLLQYLGDGSLSVFPSAVSAVEAAIEIQRGLGVEPPLPLRIGIHQGEVAFDDQGVYGDAVNVASRIQNLAPAAAVLVSGKVFDEIKNKPELPARLLGEFRLKNVAYPVRVFALIAPGIETPVAIGTGESRPGGAAAAAAPAAADGGGADPPEALLVERLNRALAPDYVIESAVDRAGESIVFVARDVMLERSVAIKLLRPGVATAATSERFLREARILASLHHPNIVAVYKAGRAESFPYYVMELITGETLAARLRRGRPSAPEAVAIARKLLDALAAAHSAGIIHRDVQPANVFLSGERLVLAGFSVGAGAAGQERAAADGDDQATQEQRPADPESGQLITERTDVYAAGMIIYEAFTGRRWVPGADAATASWAGVPRRFVRPLRRAVTPVARERWSDAVRFRRALFRRWRLGVAPRTIGWSALGGAALIAVVLLLPRPPDRPLAYADLAILPFEVGPVADSSSASAITLLTTQYLRDMAGLALVPSETAQRWWLRSDPATRRDVRLAATGLRATHVTRGMLARTGDSLHVRISIVDSAGHARLRQDFRVSAVDLTAAANRVALAIATEFLLPLPDARVPGCPSGNLDAILDYVDGERARFRGGWRRASELYRSALARDPMLMEARWQLVNVWRWMPGETPDLQPHLDTLAAGGRCPLSRTDSLMVAAQRGPPGVARLGAYARAIELDPRNPYAALLYAEEMFHRGPLAGYPADSSTMRLEAAAALDPNLAPTHELLAWHYTRLGDSASARRAAERVMQLFEPAAEPGGVAYAPLFYQAYLERFEPEGARRNRARLFAPAGEDWSRQLQFAVRAGLAFELPAVQVELGELLAAQQELGPAARAEGHLAQALAHAALGRGEQALEQLDRAVALRPSAPYRLVAAQWRVIPAALGYPLFPQAQRARAISELQRLAQEPATAARAAWTLALLANAGRTTADTSEWEARLQAAADSVAARLATFLHARRLAAENRFADALRVSEPLLAFDAGQRHGDPFARAVLHLERGRWLVSVDSAAAALRAWTWAENTDIAQWPAGAPQAAEVDWVLSPYASYLRGTHGLDTDRASACAQLRRALRYWADAGAGLRPLRDSADALRRRNCPEGSR